MALFNIGVLTRKGQALIAKSETRHVGVNLTRIQTGAGVHTDTSVSTLENLTELITPKQYFPISQAKQVEGNDSVVMITINIHNRGLTELYMLNEMAVWAEDPDEGEILYSILVSTNNMVYLPADNGTGDISAILEHIYLEVTNASQTTINTTGAVVGRDEFETLCALVHELEPGLTGGSNRQILMKTSDDNYGYGWADPTTFTGPLANFPEEGAVGSIYIDTDSAEIYVWKLLQDGTMGYFKLPLGSEASQTLQAQITTNANNIRTLQETTAELGHRGDEVEIVVRTADWVASEEDEIPVYSQTIALTGMTAEKTFDVLPAPQSTGAADLEAEQKAIGIFFAHGTVEGDEDAINLSCRKKKPATDFGIAVRGNLT